MHKYRVYIDTSVYGGVFDVKFQEPSKLFFKQIRENKFRLVTSAVVQEEISPAPKEVFNFFQSMLPYAEVIEITEDVLLLRDAYLKAKILSKRFSDDALHVALATISKCSVVVSWNFKHIVHFEKIPLYNAVNVSGGYHPIAIYSPMGVINYE